MELSTEFWIQIILYISSFAAVFSSFRTRLKNLEKKMDKYNNLQERMIKVEQSAKSAHRRLDEINHENDSR